MTGIFPDPYFLPPYSLHSLSHLPSLVFRQPPPLFLITWTDILCPLAYPAAAALWLAEANSSRHTFASLGESSFPSPCVPTPPFDFHCGCPFVNERLSVFYFSPIGANPTPRPPLRSLLPLCLPDKLNIFWRPTLVPRYFLPPSHSIWCRFLPFVHPPLFGIRYCLLCRPTLFITSNQSTPQCASSDSTL